MRSRTGRWALRRFQTSTRKGIPEAKLPNTCAAMSAIFEDPNLRWSARLLVGFGGGSRAAKAGQLYEAMIAAAGLGADDRRLEIGCASGKATLPLARRGFRITCVEPGSALADEARRNLASFPEVEGVRSTFEDIEPSAL